VHEELIKARVLKSEPSYKFNKELGISQEAVDFLKLGLTKDKKIRPNCQ